jgi:hypothetical protein
MPCQGFRHSIDPGRATVSGADRPAARHGLDPGALCRRYLPETRPAQELAAWPSTEPQGLPAGQPDAGAARAAAGDAERLPGLARLEVLLAVAAFAVLCTVALSVEPQLNADGYAYRASIIAVTDGHFGILSTAQFQALAAQLDRCPPSARSCQFGSNIEFWVQLSSGRWFSEKDPGYPFLAAPFQWLGIIRLAPLFYGALGCLGLFFGARRWLGRFGGTAAVGLFCSSGGRCCSPGRITGRPSPRPR